MPIDPPGLGVWASLDRWLVELPLTIDRLRGSAHPRCSGLVCPLDYGSLAGTRSADGPNRLLPFTTTEHRLLF
jgi:hypothetical protein